MSESIMHMCVGLSVLIVAIGLFCVVLHLIDRCKLKKQLKEKSWKIVDISGNVKVLKHRANSYLLEKQDLEKKLQDNKELRITETREHKKEVAKLKQEVSNLKISFRMMKGSCDGLELCNRIIKNENSILSKCLASAEAQLLKNEQCRNKKKQKK